jgi:hypothetical protein
LPRGKRNNPTASGDIGKAAGWRSGGGEVEASF